MSDAPNQGPLSRLLNETTPFQHGAKPGDARFDLGGALARGRPGTDYVTRPAAARRTNSTLSRAGQLEAALQGLAPQEQAELEEVQAGPPIQVPGSIGAAFARAKQLIDTRAGPQDDREVDAIIGSLSSYALDDKLGTALDNMQAYREGVRTGKPVKWGELENAVASLPSLNPDAKAYELAAWFTGDRFHPLIKNADGTEEEASSLRMLRNRLTGEERKLPALNVSWEHMRFMLQGDPISQQLVVGPAYDAWTYVLRRDHNERKKGTPTPIGFMPFVPNLGQGSVEADAAYMQRPEVMVALLDLSTEPEYEGTFGAAAFDALTGSTDFVLSTAMTSGFASTLWKGAALLGARSVAVAGRVRGLSGIAKAAQRAGAWGRGTLGGIGKAFTGMPLARKAGAVATGLNFDPRQVFEEVIYQMMVEGFVNPRNEPFLERMVTGARAGAAEGVTELGFGVGTRVTRKLLGKAGVSMFSSDWIRGSGANKFADQFEVWARALDGQSPAQVAERMLARGLAEGARGVGRHGARVAAAAKRAGDADFLSPSAFVDDMVARSAKAQAEVGLRRTITQAISDERVEIAKEIAGVAERMGVRGARAGRVFDALEMVSNGLALGTAFGGYMEAVTLARRDGIALDGWATPLETLHYMRQVQWDKPQIAGSAFGMMMPGVSMMAWQSLGSKAYREFALSLTEDIGRAASLTNVRWGGRVDRIGNEYQLSGKWSGDDQVRVAAKGRADAKSPPPSDYENFVNADLEDIAELWHWQAPQVGPVAPSTLNAQGQAVGGFSPTQNEVELGLRALSSMELRALQRRIRSSGYAQRLSEVDRLIDVEVRFRLGQARQAMRNGQSPRSAEELRMNTTRDLIEDREMQRRRTRKEIEDLTFKEMVAARYQRALKRLRVQRANVPPQPTAAPQQPGAPGQAQPQGQPAQGQAPAQPGQSAQPGTQGAQAAPTGPMPRAPGFATTLANTAAQILGPDGTGRSMLESLPPLEPNASPEKVAARRRAAETLRALANVAKPYAAAAQAYEKALHELQGGQADWAVVGLLDEMATELERTGAEVAMLSAAAEVAIEADRGIVPQDSLRHTKWKRGDEEVSATWLEKASIDDLRQARAYAATEIVAAMLIGKGGGQRKLSEKLQAAAEKRFRATEGELARREGRKPVYGGKAGAVFEAAGRSYAGEEPKIAAAQLHQVLSQEYATEYIERVTTLAWHLWKAPREVLEQWFEGRRVRGRNARLEKRRTGWSVVTRDGETLAGTSHGQFPTQRDAMAAAVILTDPVHERPAWVTSRTGQRAAPRSAIETPTGAAGVAATVRQGAEQRERARTGDIDEPYGPNPTTIDAKPPPAPPAEPVTPEVEEIVEASGSPVVEPSKLGASAMESGTKGGPLSNNEIRGAAALGGDPVVVQTEQDALQTARFGELLQQAATYRALGGSRAETIDAFTSKVLELWRSLNRGDREEFLSTLEGEVAQYRDAVGLTAFVESKIDGASGRREVDRDQNLVTLASEIGDVDPSTTKFVMELMSLWSGIKDDASGRRQVAMSLPMFAARTPSMGSAERRGAALGMLLVFGATPQSVELAAAVSALPEETVEALRQSLLAAAEDALPTAVARLRALEADIKAATGIEVEFVSDKVLKRKGAKVATTRQRLGLTALALPVPRRDASDRSKRSVRSLGTTINNLNKSSRLHDELVTVAEAQIRSGELGLDEQRVLGVREPVAPSAADQAVRDAARAVAAKLAERVVDFAAEALQVSPSLRDAPAEAALREAWPQITVGGKPFELSDTAGQSDMIPGLNVTRLEVQNAVIAAVSGDTSVLTVRQVEGPKRSIIKGSGETAGDKKRQDEGERVEEQVDLEDRRRRDATKGQATSSVRVVRRALLGEEARAAGWRESLFSGAEVFNTLQGAVVPTAEVARHTQRLAATTPNLEVSEQSAPSTERYTLLDGFSEEEVGIEMAQLMRDVATNSPGVRTQLRWRLDDTGTQWFYANDAEFEAEWSRLQEAVFRYQFGARLAIEGRLERDGERAALAAVRDMFLWMDQSIHDEGIDPALEQRLLAVPGLAVELNDGTHVVSEDAIRRYIVSAFESSVSVKERAELGGVLGFPDPEGKASPTAYSFGAVLAGAGRLLRSIFRPRSIAAHIGGVIAADFRTTIGLSTDPNNVQTWLGPLLPRLGRVRDTMRNWGGAAVVDQVVARIAASGGKLKPRITNRDEWRALVKAFKGRNHRESLSIVGGWMARSLWRLAGVNLGKLYENYDGTQQVFVPQEQAEMNRKFADKRTDFEVAPQELALTVEIMGASMESQAVSLGEAVIAAVLIDTGLLSTLSNPKKVADFAGVSEQRAAVILNVAFELAKVADRSGMMLVNAGQISQEAFERMRGRWFPVVTQTDYDEPTYQRRLPTTSAPFRDGNSFARSYDYSELAATRMMDIRRVMPAKLLAEAMNMQGWASLRASNDVGALITAAEYEALLTPGSPTFNPGRAMMFVKANRKPETGMSANAKADRSARDESYGNLNDAFTLERFVANEEEKLETKTEMADRLRTGFPTNGKQPRTLMKDELIDKLKDGYISRSVMQEVALSLVDADRPFSVIDETYQRWRRLRTVMSPRFWITNLVSGVLSNALTGRIGLQGALSAAIGMGPYARAAEQLEEYERAYVAGHIVIGVDGTFTVDPNLDAVTRKRLEINTWMLRVIGGGTWHRTISGMGMTLTRQSMLGATGIGSGADAMLAAAVDKIGGQNAVWVRRAEDAVWNASTGGSAAERATAFREFLGQHQRMELLLKFSAAHAALPSISETDEKGKPRTTEEIARRAAHAGMPGTVNYGARSPFIARWSQSSSMWLSPLEKQSRVAQGKSVGVGAQAAHALKILTFSRPFLSYSAGIIPTMAYTFTTRPVYFVLQSYLAAIAANMLFLPDEEEEHQIRSDEGGRAGFTVPEKPARRWVPTLEQDPQVVELLRRELGDVRMSYNSIPDGTGTVKDITLGEYLDALQELEVARVRPLHEMWGVGVRKEVRVLGRQSYMDFARYLDLTVLPTLWSARFQRAYTGMREGRMDMIAGDDAPLGPMALLGLAGFVKAKAAIEGVGKGDLAPMMRSLKDFSAEWVAALGPLAILNGQHGFRALEEAYDTRIEDVYSGVYHAAAAERSAKSRAMTSLGVALLPFKSTSPMRSSKGLTFDELIVSTLTEAGYSTIRPDSAVLERRISSKVMAATLKTIEGSARYTYQMLIDRQSEADASPSFSNVMASRTSGIFEDIVFVDQGSDKLPLRAISKDPKSDLGIMLRNMRESDPKLHDLQIRMASALMASSQFKRTMEVAALSANNLALGPAEFAALWSGSMESTPGRTLAWLEDELGNHGGKSVNYLSAMYDLLSHLEVNSDSDKDTVARLKKDYFPWAEYDTSWQHGSPEQVERSRKGYGEMGSKVHPGDLPQIFGNIGRAEAPPMAGHLLFPSRQRNSDQLIQ